VPPYLVAAEQALAADTPASGFFGKLRGRAAEAQRYAVSNDSTRSHIYHCPYQLGAGAGRVFATI
jgi:hypothetical protein